MTKSGKLAATAFAVLATLGYAGSSAHAAQCGSGSGGYEAWKQSFAREAQAKGIGANAISALMGTTYAQATINADRSLHSFKLSLGEFMNKRWLPNALSMPQIAISGPAGTP